ncbi:MAG: hypothetical protein LBM77_02730 [Spirochaetaceae bacterium]|jgi:hypothetical protein|nr:hypothetical protein [Spirochaetaceae bacterium]
MKNKKVFIGLLAGMLALSMVFVACSPDGGGGGGGGGVEKPAALANDATYQDALDKCDEIIEYCEANSNGTNDGIKLGVEAYKTTTIPAAQSTWSLGSGTGIITALNGYIATLQ